MVRHLSTFPLRLPFALNARCAPDARWGLKKQNAILSSFIAAVSRTNDGFRCVIKEQSLKVTLPGGWELGGGGENHVKGWCSIRGTDSR